jgi:hypothetical protein
MKLVRWAAAVVVTLMALLNLGSVAGDDGAGIKIPGLVLGVAGLVAVYALIRGRTWGAPTAAGVSVVNLVLAVVAVALDWSGGAVGIVLNVVALALILPLVVRRRSAVAAH